MRLIRWVLVVTLGESCRHQCAGSRGCCSDRRILGNQHLLDALILIYGIAGFCMAATEAVVTGVGNYSAVQTPIKVDDWSQADQARRVSGSADAHVE